MAETTVNEYILESPVKKAFRTRGLVEMFNTLREDIRTVFEKDPAARSILEVLTCYPGLHALWLYRFTRFFWHHRMKLFARMLSNFGRWATAIEIHPGAKIGRRFFIDHGSGVVIGETAEVGSDVLMYQGVVLGGTSLKKEKRHPTIGNHVVIGTGAVILGAITIGDHSRIGAGSVVVKSVPADSTVVGIPGKIVEDGSEHIPELEHGKMPDPIAEAINLVLRQQTRLASRVKKVEELSGVAVQEDDFESKRKGLIREFSNGGGI
ncbi:serine O-acetyltransferase [Chloroflexota bacterium]